MKIMLSIILALQPGDAASKKAAEIEAGGDHLKAAKAWAGVKGYPARERMAACLEKAWDGAQDPAPLRAQLLQFAAPPAGYEKSAKGQQPAGWWTLTEQFGASIDNKFAWTGAKSLKLLPPKGSETGWSSAETLQVPLGAAKRVTASVWIFAYDTDAGGRFNIHFDDAAGKRITASSVPVIGDRPFWKRYEVSADVPAGAKLASLRVDVKIVKGAFWCDEISFSDGTKDLFMGGGFER